MRKMIWMAAAFLAMAGTKAQNVGIGNNAPHASALVDMTSNTQGLLIPRLTKTEKSAIPSPATGLMVYQTGPDSSGFHYFTGTGWAWINPNSAASGGGLPASAVVLSETQANTALTAAGFSYRGLLRLPGATVEQTGPVAANNWLPTNTALLPPSSGHLATFNDSVFYVWGGNNGTQAPGIGLYKYSPLADQWTNMNVTGTAPTIGSTGVKLGNRWVHWGGYTFPALGSPPAFVYNFTNNTITQSAPAPISNGLAGVSAVGSGNKAYFFGGYSLANFSILVNQGFVYDAQANTWQAMTINDAPAERYHAGMVHTGTHIMVWGGFRNSGVTNTGGLYDIASDTWLPTSTTNAPAATIDPIMVWRSPYVYVLSGNSTKRYNPATHIWETLGATPANFTGNKFTYDAANGKIYIWGGNRVFFAPVPTANGYVYDIVNDFYTTLPLTNAPDARGDHTFTFGNNMLLAWGGTANNSPSQPTTAQSLNTGGRFLLAPATATAALPAPAWHLFKKN
jgi:N-acetylneuraminic acid mutarotase